jgi:transcription elongation factor SPT4
MAAIMNPKVSWVARWQRIDRFHQGIYAVRVTGRLPEDAVEELDKRGIKYRPRDGAVIVE